MSDSEYVSVSLTLDELKEADPQGWSDWADENVHAIELSGYVDPAGVTGTLDLVVWDTNRVDSKRVHDNWVEAEELPKPLRHRIACECGTSVIDDGVAIGIIRDLELEIGTADLDDCRLAMNLAEGDHLTPDAMRRLSDDPRRHTESDLRSALIMLGCKEVPSDL